MTPLGRGTGIPRAVSLIQIGVEVYLLQSTKRIPVTSRAQYQSYTAATDVLFCGIYSSTGLAITAVRSTLISVHTIQQYAYRKAQHC
jgi:hypothetical protein